jgi:hypothetical protein
MLSRRLEPPEMRLLFRLLGSYYLWRAVFRGPAYLARFLLRRGARRRANRAIRRWL